MFKRREHSQQSLWLSKRGVCPPHPLSLRTFPRRRGTPVRELTLTGCAELGFAPNHNPPGLGLMETWGRLSQARPTSVSLGHHQSSRGHRCYSSKLTHLLYWPGVSGNRSRWQQRHHRDVLEQSAPGFRGELLLLWAWFWVPACLSNNSPQTDLDGQGGLWMLTRRLNQKKLPFL